MNKNVTRKINEIKETVNCFFANADVEENNVVLVNKNDEDNVIVFERGFNYYWSNNNGLAIHIGDIENKIDIPVSNVEEDECDLDTLYLDNYMLTVL
ncbi:hypothetical protein [Clostridium sp. UBA1056]|uniref:hypothetical protein n=1 Tax=unclassified Clostridium TaxID=2614128 RepID=UPI0032169140